MDDMVILKASPFVGKETSDSPQYGTYPEHPPDCSPPNSLWVLMKRLLVYL